MWNSIKKWVYKHPWYTFWILLFLVATLLIIAAIVVLFFIWLFSKKPKDDKSEITTKIDIIKSYKVIPINENDEFIKAKLKLIDNDETITDVTISPLPYNKYTTKLEYNIEDFNKIDKLSNIYMTMYTKNNNKKRYKIFINDIKKLKRALKFNKNNNKQLLNIFVQIIYINGFTTYISDNSCRVGNHEFYIIDNFQSKNKNLFNTFINNYTIKLSDKYFNPNIL